MASIFNSIFIPFLLFSFVVCSALQRNQTIRQVAYRNPLVGVPFHINGEFRQGVIRSIKRSNKQEKGKLRRLINIPTATWLTEKANVWRTSRGRTAESVLKDASKKNRTPLVTFVVYNLPNRDCAADASGGKICCKYNADRTCNYYDTSNKCENGLREYKHEFIDLLAKTVKRYCKKVPMTLVIEPDSLPNLVTNLKNRKCSNRATKASYREGTKYAVKKLKSACSKATIYVDAAHGGWLGWEASSIGFLREIKQLGIASLIRGFALNVSNYQEMGMLCPKVGTCLPSSATRGHKCCKRDACKLSSKYNPGFSLLNYAASLRKIARSILPGPDVHFLMDTGRNGITYSRKSSCSNWCNVRGAGLGALPTTKTVAPLMIDAYMWLKVPGHSDGCTKRLPNGGKCVRFDKACASADSVGSKAWEPRAPSAGKWFDFHLRSLVRDF